MKSKFQDVQIPTDVSFADFVLQCVRKHEQPSKVALVAADIGEEVTYKQLLDQVMVLAGSLQGRGLVKGDIVSVISDNRPEFPVVMLAVLLAGGTVNMFSPLYHRYEMSEQLLDVGPKFIFTTAEVAEKVENACKKGQQVQELFVLGLSTTWTTYSDLLKEKRLCLQQVAVDPTRDVAVIAYSSGTSGSPKGVMLTHVNLIANLLQHSVAEIMGGEGRQEVYICVPPFTHCYGLIVVLLFGLTQGHKLVTMARFYLDKYLQAIQKYKATILHVAPPMVMMFLNSPLVNKSAFLSVHTLICGSAPLNIEVTRQLKAKLQGIVIRQGYGMTETSPGTHMSPRSKQKPGAIGVIIPNTECQVVDVRTGRELPAHKPGEIWVRGPQIMLGYRNNSAQTKAMIDEDGWLHTGDIGFYDTEDYFYIIGRLKEVIKYKGFQVSPASLELLMLGHPLIADVAVIGVPDREAGELPRAFVVKKTEGDSLTEADVVQYVADRVSPHKQLRGGVVFVASLPKTPLGKILRRVLMERPVRVTVETKSKL